jgi:hypothetical protein
VEHLPLRHAAVARVHGLDGRLVLLLRATCELMDDAVCHGVLLVDRCALVRLVVAPWVRSAYSDWNRAAEPIPADIRSTVR